MVVVEPVELDSDYTSKTAKYVSCQLTWQAIAQSKRPACLFITCLFITPAPKVLVGQEVTWH